MSLEGWALMKVFDIANYNSMLYFPLRYIICPHEICGLIAGMFQMDSKKCKAKTNLFTFWFITIGCTVRSWLIKQWLFSHISLELCLIVWAFYLLQAFTSDGQICRERQLLLQICSILASSRFNRQKKTLLCNSTIYLLEESGLWREARVEWLFSDICWTRKINLCMVLVLAVLQKASHVMSPVNSQELWHQLCVRLLK